MNVRAFVLALVWLSAALRAASPTSQPETSTALARQVYAIFAETCTECHGADLARPKGDFGYVLDLAAVAANPDYIVPGKPDESELYRMIEDDEMPGEDATVPVLSDEEKASIRRWIEIGAPAFVAENNPVPEASPSPMNSASRPVHELTFPRRLIRALGQFHPPSSHFPIALLIAALPAEFMWITTRKRSWKATVRFCVTLGAVSAAFTAALGWCDAAFSNYTGALAPVLAWHRWLGTATALWALFTALLSEYAHKEKYPRGMRRAFRAVLAAGIVLVSISGYLGASLIYGLRHFRW